jgi:hypothetical protein
MYQENSKIDQITVTQNGTVFVRNSIIVTKDGVEISKTYLRNTLVPNSDISEYPANVQSICAAAWTPEIVAAYKEKISNLT